MEFKKYRKFTDYIKDLHKTLWSSDLRHVVQNKRFSRELAEELGFNLPREIKIPKRVVVKPIDGDTSKGVRVIDRHRFIIEEAVTDQWPPYNYRFLVFNGTCEYMYVTQNVPNEEEGLDRSRTHNWYSRYDGTFIPVFNVVKKPFIDGFLLPRTEELECAVKLAERFYRRVQEIGRIPFIRVDFFISSAFREIFFNEVCFTPGWSEPQWCAITDKYDRIFGSLVSSEA